MRSVVAAPRGDTVDAHVQSGAAAHPDWRRSEYDTGHFHLLRAKKKRKRAD